MPRTESGIVPDMIMNPHAIPSRMTIAQNLEQLMGKTAALSGSIGDGTSFMNDGSPQEAIGGILEQLGFEKYGNEVMYNGATGEQIPAAIFIGPVYGMRLKHMVEDKWQARGQGRKEARTHQPTGGRGAQGGLKIGEMDRDAIIAHAGMSFVKESFMERSDGAIVSICVVCGTLPIYHPKMNISICPMCDGPVKYTGTTIDNMEILPPLGRPKSKIVQVEMPYSTKLLTQEQESYLNLTMRYITTSGIQRLRPIEYSGSSKEVASTLEELILEEPNVVPYRELEEKPVFTAEQVESLGLSIQAEKEPEEFQEEIQEESILPYQMAIAPSASNPIVIPTEPQAMQQMQQPMQQMQMQPVQQMQMQPMQPVMQQPMQPPMQQPMQPAMQPAMQPMQPVMPQMQVQQPMQQMPSIQQPMQQIQTASSQTGGFVPLQGDGLVATPQMPGMGPLIAVDTNPFTMAQQFGAEGGGRRVRRYQCGASPLSASMGPAMGPSMGPSMGPAPTMSQAMPSMPSAMGQIRITKLE
jgi:hypothetical protein